MEIHLPDEKFEKLQVHAQAAGYKDVQGLLDALIGEPTTDPRGRLSQEELRESAAACDAIAEAMESGHEHDAKQALGDLGAELGLGPAE